MTYKHTRKPYSNQTGVHILNPSGTIQCFEDTHCTGIGNGSNRSNSRFITIPMKKQKQRAQIKYPTKQAMPNTIVIKHQQTEYYQYRQKHHPHIRDTQLRQRLPSQAESREGPHTHPVKARLVSLLRQAHHSRTTASSQ